MFDGDYNITGRHATYVKYLVNDAKAFNRYIDVYMTAAVIGALNGKRAAVDGSSDRARIYADAFSHEHDKCMEIFRTIILAESSKEWNGDERTNICFRFRDAKLENAPTEVSDDEIATMKEALDLFHEYVRGGIEILYELFFSASITMEDSIDYAYKTVFDQNTRLESSEGNIDLAQLLKPEY